jgi:hypothetical protein
LHGLTLAYQTALGDQLFRNNHHLSEEQAAPAVLDPQLSASIPMTLRGVHIYVDVMVNGQGPYQFIYDSGAGITIVDKGLAESLQLTIQGELAAHGVGENTAAITLAAGVDFAMPGIAVLYQTVAILDIEHLLEERIGTRVDGILGFGFISRFVTEIDYAKPDRPARPGVKKRPNKEAVNIVLTSIGYSGAPGRGSYLNRRCFCSSAVGIASGGCGLILPLE